MSRQRWHDPDGDRFSAQEEGLGHTSLTPASPPRPQFDKRDLLLLDTEIAKAGLSTAVYEPVLARDGWFIGLKGFELYVERYARDHYRVFAGPLLTGPWLPLSRHDKLVAALAALVQQVQLETLEDV